MMAIDILEKRRELARRLLSTGWQSWSISPNVFPMGRICNFPPRSDDSLPELPQEPVRLKPPAKGWCSWYAFGPRINETKILEQVKWFSQHREIPIEYILIDDGYAMWGDWFYHDQKKFPSGLKYLSHRIKDLGFKPGIWIAPPMVHPSSRLRRQSPEFLAKHKNGHLAIAYRLTRLDKFLPLKRYLLNFRNPKAWLYLDHVIETFVENFGFELLKLDFLYAIYFDPLLKPREATTLLHDFLVRIKTRYPHVYTIACGCPLIPTVGAVDSMRIGPDIISPTLDGIPVVNRIYNYFILRGVLKNIKTRDWTRAYWNIDPDAFLCRSSTGFSRKQLLTIRDAIKRIKGNLFLGDDMTKLAEERINEFIIPLFEKH